MTGESNQGGTRLTESLESQLSIAFEDITTMFDNSVVHHEYGSFIDESLEEYFPQAKIFTDILACYGTTETGNIAAQNAAYNAFHFAYSVSAMLTTHPPKLAFRRFDRHDSELDALAQLDSDLIDFQASNPLIDILIGRYMPELDPTGMYEHIAENVARTVFLLIEETEEQEAIAEKFSAELEDWDFDPGSLDSL